jgi:hypothetical protein
VNCALERQIADDYKEALRLFKVSTMAAQGGNLSGGIFKKLILNKLSNRLILSNEEGEITSKEERELGDDKKEKLNWTTHELLWRNRLARSAVNRKVGGSNPPRSGLLFPCNSFFIFNCKINILFLKLLTFFFCRLTAILLEISGVEGLI